MTRKSFAPCVLVVALCLAGLSACGGVASANKKTDAATGAPGVGGAAGAKATDVTGNSGGVGGSVGGSGKAQGGTAAVAGEQSSGGASLDAGSFACGSLTCTATQICVIRQCGGGPVQCMAETDGGCPTGWQSGSCPSGQFGNQPVCVPEPCMRPPAECVDVPTACANAVDCLCINQSAICLDTACMSVIGREVTCAGAE